MTKPVLNLILTAFVLSAPLAVAENIDKATLKAGAIERCMLAAQERYGVAENNVEIKNDKAKWNRALKGYEVKVRIKGSRDAGTRRCIVRRNGTIKFTNSG